MAKTSIKVRNLKRKKMVENNYEQRKELKETVRKGGPNRDEASLKLQKRRRNESPSRVRERCRICERPRGTLKKFGLCRIHLRILAAKGYVPGLKKASWG